MFAYLLLLLLVLSAHHRAEKETEVRAMLFEQPVLLLRISCADALICIARCSHIFYIMPGMRAKSTRAAVKKRTIEFYAYKTIYFLLEYYFWGTNEYHLYVVQKIQRENASK